MLPTQRGQLATSQLSVGMLSTNLQSVGPVVQSAISLTSLLRVISLTVLADSIYNILIFFADKMWVAFAKATHIFSAKNFSIFELSLDVNFNESLTNDVVSFEQLGPGFTVKILAENILKYLQMYFNIVHKCQK